MMPGVDTNLLVRLLMGDDGAQLERVKALIADAGRRDIRLFVPVTVTLELEWVLRSRYGFGKDPWVDALTGLLESHEFEFQFPRALEEALHLFKEGTADFADCLHVGLCGEEGCSPLLTFDTKAARLAGVRLLGGQGTIAR